LLPSIEASKWQDIEERQLGVPRAQGSGHCNKPADIEFVMGISVQCIEATKEHFHSEHRQQSCQSSKILLVCMSQHVQFATCKGQAMDRLARSTRRKPIRSKHCLTSSWLPPTGFPGASSFLQSTIRAHMLLKWHLQKNHTQDILVPARGALAWDMISQLGNGLKQ
jgi:hypothetical protein